MDGISAALMKCSLSSSVKSILRFYHLLVISFFLFIFIYLTMTCSGKQGSALMAVFFFFLFLFFQGLPFQLRERKTPTFRLCMSAIACVCTEAYQSVCSLTMLIYATIVYFSTESVYRRA